MMDDEDRSVDRGVGEHADRIERLLVQRREENERRAVVMRDMLLLLLVFMVAYMMHPLIVRILCGAALVGLAAHLVSSWRDLKRHEDGGSDS